MTIPQKESCATPRRPSESGSANDGTMMIDWTKDEEKKLVRKLDMLVMPLLVLGFASLQLNRGNIGSALTDFFFRDVGISQDRFNVGQQLLAAGYILSELPSNLILYRVGPRIWITVLIVSWALVSIFQAFQKGLAAYLVTRLLLGLTAGGFIPAGLYCMTTWYKQSETSLRFAVFFMGNSFSMAASGLVSYGILHMRGVAGLAGWKWLFIIDGLISILVGVAFAALFPGRPDENVSLFGLSFFTEHEKSILHHRVILDDPTKEQRRTSVTGREILNAVGNWRIYPHLIMALTGLAPANALGSYSPSIVHSFGYGRLESNALASVGPLVQLFLNPIWGYMADRTGRRGFVVLAGMVPWWTFTLTSRLLIYSDSRSAKFGVLSAALVVVAVWHPINGSWVALNCRSAEERNVTMALYIMFGNLAGVVGGQIFRAKDRPLYLSGWTVCVSLISIAILCCLVAIVQYRLSNRRLRKDKVAELDSFGGALEVEAREGGQTINDARLYKE